MDGVASRKAPDSAGEADAVDASELKSYVPVKQVVLMACLAHKARMQARDELTLMFCKRIATNDEDQEG
ncbi:hypothetical protein [Streptomyces collinus]|uniref:hypothetical protein n=1 Tax=Streptomyces collinus TaxID=42684 RepID=UPI003682E67C